MRLAPDLLLADSLLATGDWDTALSTFQKLLATADPLPAGFGWRYGSLLYLRGEAQEAHGVLTVVAAECETGTPDDAMVHAWLSTVLWSTGDFYAAEETAARALRSARACGDAAARAAAHVALALVAASRGDRPRNQAEYRRARHAAEEAGDRVQLARIHANLASRALTEGDYELAVREADTSLDAGTTHRAFVALAHANRAEGLMRLGRLDEARVAATRSIEAYDAHGSLRACAPLRLLGMLDLELGDSTRARLHFERAIRLARSCGDIHGQVLAQTGLARTLVDDEPDLAARIVAEALDNATGLERATALTTAALVALRAGDRDRGAELAARAEEEARRTADLTSLAEAMELRALAGSPVHLPHVVTAIEVWRETRSPVGLARAELLLARCRNDPEAEVDALNRLAELGVRHELGMIMLTSVERQPPPPLTVLTLGRFTVLRDGVPVPVTDWQSRKARDLLKLLVARHGRAVTRDALAEVLWPDDPEAAAGNRLSVALSTLRKVLDPHKRFAPDHLVAADNGSMTLRLEHLEVDLVEFLDTARLAEAAAGRGDWRQDAAGDHDGMVRGLRQLLELDPYDERSWLALVGAHLREGHHGEARREHDAYSRRMRELRVPPVPLDQAAGRHA